MARSRAPKPVQSDFDQGYNHQQDAGSARGWPPRAIRNQFDDTPIEAHRELEYEDKSVARARNRYQFQADRKQREERRQSNGFLPARLYETGHASTSNSDETRNRFSHYTSSRPYQDADFVNVFDADRSRTTSLSYDRQLYQRHLSCPPPSYRLSGHEQQQRRLPQRVHDDNRESVHHPTRATKRFEQHRSDWSSAPIQPRDYSNTPIYRPHTGTPPDPSAHQPRGLTRRPRVQNPHKRVSRLQGGSSTRSVDLGAPQVTKMDYSVMSVAHPDGSGSSLNSRFVLPTTTARPITIRASDCGSGHLGASPSSHVDSETERSQSRIKVREGAGSAFTNIHSIPKKEPNTLASPSLMNYMEEGWASLSPASMPRAPPLDQHPVIREDLHQEGGGSVARCRTDLPISFCEAAAVEDRKSLYLAHSTSPSLGVSHLQTHAAPANKGRKEPGQQMLFQELYQMLDSPEDSGSDTLCSRMEIRKERGSGEGIIRPGCACEEETSPDTPRGPQGSEQTLHVDILLAQRVVRDAMREEEEGVEFPDRSCMWSASECGEEAVDSNSNWSERGLHRENSTRSVFDWGYA